MSNAKLKEQIEAAKIALVHSAEADTFADKPSASGNLTPTPSISTAHAKPHSDSNVPEDKTANIDGMANADSVADMPHIPVNVATQTVGQETIAQSDFEKLEIRLQVLEDQIKNQQRDLHTLLQKLRGIAAKSQSAADPKKGENKKKLIVGAILCLIGFGTFCYWIGAEVITSTLYQITGFIMALIDTLAGKI